MKQGFHEQDTAKTFNVSGGLSEDYPIINLIEQTRATVKLLSQQQRFQKAKTHFQDALSYKHPRIDIFDPNNPAIFKIVHDAQTSEVWQTFLRFLSFIYMYLILFEHKENSTILYYASPSILCVFWVDLLLQFFQRSFDTARNKSKFPQLVFTRLGLLTCLLCGQILYLAKFSIGFRQIQPFRVLRAFLPVLYISEIRRSFEAILSAYKDIFVYFIFYSTIIVSFAFIGSSIIQLTPDQIQNPDFITSTNDYQSMSSMVFIMYVVATYDAYPDNQLFAIQSSTFYYAFFVVFIFMNMFLYSSIPGSLIFDKYRQTRSTIILIDEIKMQHSLIIAFISLGDDNYQIDIQYLIKFLHYLYDNRVRYIDPITEICLKLNDDGNCSIHVTEFMQLGRILQANSSLKPPSFKDWPVWISFRRKINSLLGLKSIISSQAFNLILAVLVILSFINSAQCIYSPSQLVYLFNQVFTYLYLAEILLKTIGLGMENYFNDIWNLIDFLLAFSGLVAQLALNLSSYSALFKMFRIYRATHLFRTLFHNSVINLDMEIYKKIRNLFGTIIIILPLIARFFPLFLITYYVLGVIGMELFYGTYQDGYQEKLLGNLEVFSFYTEFSNFKTFINTQFVFVQVLTQAGWSSIAFDLALRNSSYFSLVMCFFIFCHITIVLIIATLLRSIFWSVFFTVTEQYDERHKIERGEMQKQEDAQKKIAEYVQLDALFNNKIANHQIQGYNTLMKRYLYELAANKQILAQIYSRNKIQKITKRCQKVVNAKMHRNFKSDKQQMTLIQKQGNNQNENAQNFLFAILKKLQAKNSTEPRPFSQIEQVQEEDIQEHLKVLSNKLCKKIQTKSNYIVRNTDLLRKHLAGKLNAPYSIHKKNTARPHQISMQKLTSKDSISFQVFTLHLLLNMRTSKRQQKSLVIQSLVDSQDLDEYQSKDLLIKKVTERSFNIDQNCTIRRMYLSDTNKKLVQKFEAQYFADIYGSCFKQTNRVTIEPLVKLESTLTYALKNVLRYPQVSGAQFFKIVSKIEDQISNKLLKKGSLFKFVFQLNSKDECWFSIHYNHLNETSLNFIKHGVWLCNEDLIQNQIYYGSDIFKFDKTFQEGTLQEKTKLMKHLFSTYQSLAFSLLDKDSFFESSPLYNVYDTFINYTDVSRIQRLSPKQFQISKIMVVLLTKQQERTEQNALLYDISDIEIPEPVDEIDFTLDQSQSATFQKLSNLSSLNDEEITANEGMPIANVLNLICQINDILKLYSPNFTHQIEKILNHELNKCDESRINIIDILDCLGGQEKQKHGVKDEGRQQY